IKLLLLKSKCPPGRPLPGQRIPTSIPQALAVRQTNSQLILNPATKAMTIMILTASSQSAKNLELRGTLPKATTIKQ
ncbi:hypothetical protein BX661DRAFT_183601, partial [Kickxella alabastrina]|uniref:uncharacterized protein n=1 Tax=Kickxella alabastrina TaxID=61397 RepID=UPI002220E5E0